MEPLYPHSRGLSGLVLLLVLVWALLLALLIRDLALTERPLPACPAPAWSCVTGDGSGPGGAAPHGGPPRLG